MRLSFRYVVSVLCILWTLLQGRALFAQELTLSGVVLDTEDRTMTGVVVLAKDQNGRMLAYTITDEQGKFAISPGNTATEIEFSLVGYKKQSIKAPFDNARLVIRMEESVERLESAVIRERVVRVHGDTLEYNAAAIRADTDRSLGDVLQRLPGVTMQKNGTVLFNGRPISRLYVDGRDILRGEYRLATENLDARTLKTIEVYRNHQAVKALSGLIEEESAALNITLTDLARGRWTVTLDAGGGLSAAPSSFAYSADAFGANVSRNMASLNKAGVNNVGALPRFNDSGYIIRVGEDRFNRYRLREQASIHPDFAPLEDEHSALNRSIFAQTVNNFATGAYTTVGISVKASRDMMRSSLESKQRYQMAEEEGGEKVFADLTEKNSTQKYASIAADITMNAPHKYIKNVLFADYRDLNGTGMVSGERGMDQKTKGRRWNLNNIFNATIRKEDQRAFGINWYSQFSKDDSELALFLGERSQGFQTSVFYSGLDVTGVSRSYRGWNFEIIPGLSMILRNARSDLNGIVVSEWPTAYDLATVHIRPQLNLRVSRQIKTLRFSGNLQTAYHYYSFRSGESWQNSFPVLSGGLSARYQSGYWEIAAGWDHGNQAISDQTVFPALTLRTHNMLWVGRHDLARLPMDRMSLSVNVQDPLTGVYLTLSGARTESRSFLQSRQVLDQYIIQIESDEQTRMITWTGDLTLSKGVSAIRGKVDAGIGYTSIASWLRQNNTNTAYVSGVWDVYLRCKANPVRWLEINYDGSGSRTSITLASAKSQTVPAYSLRQRMIITGTVASRWELQASAEHYLTKLEESQGIILLDASVSCTIGRQWRIWLRGLNLLNQVCYQIRSVSAMMQSSQTYQIRPATVILGLEMRF